MLTLSKKKKSFGGTKLYLFISLSKLIVFYMHGKLRERERESFCVLTIEFKVCSECVCVMVILRKGGINLFL